MSLIDAVMIRDDEIEVSRYDIVGVLVPILEYGFHLGHFFGTRAWVQVDCMNIECAAPTI